MKRKLMLTLFVVIVLSFATPMMAADGVDATPLFMWSIIIGGLALALAASAGAFAQSKAFQVAAENIGRNPASADSIRGVLIIALALIESLVIYVLLIDLIIFFVKWGKYTVG